tara:strand:- start:1138 stop:1293 length:156 start_codon:yes stop_codon:yes gene_type:complete
MKALMKNIQILLSDESINNIEVKKVEDSKVELWSGGRYFGRQKVNIKENIN